MGGVHTGGGNGNGKTVVTEIVAEWVVDPFVMAMATEIIHMNELPLLLPSLPV